MDPFDRYIKENLSDRGEHRARRLAGYRTNGRRGRPRIGPLLRAEQLNLLRDEFREEHDRVTSQGQPWEERMGLTTSLREFCDKFDLAMPGNIRVFERRLNQLAEAVHYGGKHLQIIVYPWNWRAGYRPGADTKVGWLFVSPPAR